MPSWNHEGIVEVFRRTPRLAAELLVQALGLSLPAFSEVELGPKTMEELKPAELFADLVIVLENGGVPVLGIVLEVQREEEEQKLWAWPAYVVWLRRHLRAETCVLVVTHSQQVAAWASRPIVLGPGATMQPLVLGPGRVPVVRDVAAARRAPELGVLSALVHGQGPVDTAAEVALAAAQAAHDLDRDQFLLYFGLIWASLSDAAKKVFEMLPQGAQFYDESQQRSYERGLEKGRSQGLAESKAADVVAVLEARGLVATDEQRERIRSTTDLDTLDRWIRRAATVESTVALFE